MGAVPALVFIHGFACSHADWHNQVAHFAPRHPVLAPDLRGHGNAPGLPAQCSIETYGADIVEGIGKEGWPHAVLVGHSMGCRVVLEAALRAPERVAGLVLIDGSALASGDPAAAERAMAEKIRAAGFAAFQRPFFETMFLPSSDPALKAAAIASALALPEEIGSVLFPRLAAWDASKLERALASLHVPVLIIQSTRIDPQRGRLPMAAGETSPWLELVRHLVPAARIEIVSGVGHFAQLEAPERVNQMIGNFLRES